MAGRLNWACITVTKHTFIVKTQRIVDYAIEGCLAVEDMGVFSRMHDAKTDFHCKLFKPERKSYYSDVGAQIVNERRATANVDQLRRMVGSSSSAKHRPQPICKTTLAEDDITKAYAGAFMHSKAAPIFNELDAWKPFEKSEPIKNYSLYVVEPGSFYRFFVETSTCASATASS